MAFHLAKDQKALALIVTAKQATEQEIYAATELRNYLTMITGAAFDVVEVGAGEKQIFVGRAAQPFIGIDESLGEDGFRVKATDEYIAIDGGKRFPQSRLISAGCRISSTATTIIIISAPVRALL